MDNFEGFEQQLKKYYLSYGQEPLCLSCGDDSIISAFPLFAEETILRLPCHKDKIYDMIIVNENLYSVSHDKTIKIWELRTMKLLKTIELSHQGERLLYFKEKNILVVSSSYHIEVIDLGSFNIINKVTPYQREDYYRHFQMEKCSESSFITMGTFEYYFKVWDLNLNCIASFPFESEIRNFVKLNEDQVAIGFSSGLVSIRNCSTFEELKSFYPFPDTKNLLRIGYSERKPNLLFCSDYSSISGRAIKIFDLNSLECLKTIQTNYGSGVIKFQIHPYRNLLVLSFNSGWVNFLDMDNDYKELSPIWANSAAVRQILFLQ